MLRDLLIAFGLGLSSAALAAGDAPSPAPDSPAPDGAPAASADAAVQPASPDAIESWLDSVVVLVTGPAWCSGVVLDDTTIATAYHCVATGMRTRVRTRSGAEYMGRMVAADPDEDLALVRVEELDGALPALPIRADPVRRGVRVYGLGHPFGPAAQANEAYEGLLLWSVTEGIVSAAGPRLIQTDAALNPGNSGGPVVDAQGRIVGITSRKLQADNIAFLSSAAMLAELVADPERPSPLGGTVSVGFSYLSGAAAVSGDFDGREAAVAQSLLLTGAVAIRERLVLSGGVGFSSGARFRALERGRAFYPSSEATLALRQRIGRGVWSTAIDVGGGYTVLPGVETDFDPETGRFLARAIAPLGGPTASVRVGVQGVGLRVVALLDDVEDPLWMVGLDLEPFGVLKTF